jgi:alpha/beta superfamily hydrolase
MSARTLSIPVSGTPHKLEARLRAQRPETPLAVVAPPHPVYGGTIGNPVVRALENAFQSSGLSTLAFNFRGTGEFSVGEPSGEEEPAKQDYLAVVHSVSSSLPGTSLSWLSGYSFGSVAALAAAVELDFPRVLMVGPPFALLNPLLLERYRGELTIVVGSEDEYAPVEQVREVFGARPHTRLEILDGLEHFFLGSAVEVLAEALTRVLPRAQRPDRS